MANVDQLSQTPPPVGFRFDDRQVVVERARQVRKLECCGVNPAIWGSAADPSFFAFYTIMAQRWTGRSINGNVHMSQKYILNAALPLDVPLWMKGEVVKIDPHPRGERVWADFTFTDNDGIVRLRANRSSLNPGKTNADAPRISVPSLDLANMELVNETILEPDKVAAFSDEAENLIHSDPVTAKKFGFRAPIAGGLMASHIMLGGLVAEADQGGISELEGEIFFLRPMFWDERLRFIATPANTGGPRLMTLIGDDDKPRCRATISHIRFGNG
jgi:hypothetical protein